MRGLIFFLTTTCQIFNATYCLVGRRNSFALSRGRTRPKRIAPSAYAYAEGDGPIPKELVLLNYVDRFDAQAVFGRTPGAGELKGMIMAEQTMNAYNMRKNYKDDEGKTDWVEFANKYPYYNWLLIMGAKDGA